MTFSPIRLTTPAAWFSSSIARTRPWFAWPLCLSRDYHCQLSLQITPASSLPALAAHSLAHIAQTPSTCQVAPNLLVSCSPMLLPNLGVSFITASFGNHASSMQKSMPRPNAACACLEPPALAPLQSSHLLRDLQCHVVSAMLCPYEPKRLGNHTTCQHTFLDVLPFPIQLLSTDLHGLSLPRQGRHLVACPSSPTTTSCCPCFIHLPTVA